MSVHTMCPVCGAGYDLDDGLLGQWVGCKVCQSSFLVAETLRAPASARIAGALPPRTVPAAAPYADDRAGRDDWPDLRRRRRQEPQSSGMPVGAIVALVVTPIVLLVAVVLLIWWLTLPEFNRPARRNFPMVNNNWQNPQPVFNPNPRPLNPGRVNPPFNPPPIPVRGPGPGQFRPR